ncbi:potassium transporter TrkA [Grimontia sp. AD028]|uniref:SLC13 family permease n=1 Tax=Grimontia sp. AD028 TaxID=1581149 RepID=UPI00061B0A7E|nr:SLC13 family permease [Grimontia sp. AD028]KKD61349.1 potassium transporter TrkA [Grimontia sp. AD028]
MFVTALVIIGLLLCLIFSQYRAVLLFAVATIVLYLFGQIEQSELLSNVTNSAVLTLIGLMIASLALERSYLLPWLSSKVFHASYPKTLFNLAISTALSSAFLNNTAVVATLMAGVQRNQEHAPNRLLIPLSYFAILGGTLTLIGTATNLVVNALLVEMGQPELGFFDFLPVGLTLLVSVGIIIAIGCSSLHSTPTYSAQDQGYFIDAEVSESSKLVGKTVRENQLRSLDGLFLAEIVRGKQLISPVTPETLIEAKDKLVFTGDVGNIKQLKLLDGVEIFADNSQLLSSNLTEVIVSPESVLIGKTLKSSGFRSRFDAAVVAINREGQRLSGKLGEQIIQSGDKLVLAVGQDFNKRQNLARNFFILSGIELNNTLTAKQSFFAIGGFVAAVFTSALTSISLLEAIGAYIVAMIGMEVIDGTTIRRRFPFELWLILVCALSIAQSFSDSGLANAVTEILYQSLGTSSPYTALAVLFFVTVIMTELITNTAAAAIMLPIGVALANVYQVSTMPFIMAVAYAASACFISPYGYQTNLMVMNAGGYSFKDFIRVGWKVSLSYIVVALLAIPLIFPF